MREALASKRAFFNRRYGEGLSHDVEDLRDGFGGFGVVRLHNSRPAEDVTESANCLASLPRLIGLGQGCLGLCVGRWVYSGKCAAHRGQVTQALRGFPWRSGIVEVQGLLCLGDDGVRRNVVCLLQLGSASGALHGNGTFLDLLAKTLTCTSGA